MRFRPTRLAGVVVAELEPRGDARGFFARAWCADELRAAGLSGEVAQANLSYSARAGTLRGLHYQAPPHAEAKFVRCIRGAVWDVALDLRPGSPTEGEWAGVELSSENRLALHVPEGCAHGYQTLADDTELLYLTSARYAPEAEGGVRWDDPAFAIEWPLDPTELSEKDRAWPDYERLTRKTAADSE